jgi:hypothetical protein
VGFSDCSVVLRISFKERTVFFSSIIREIIYPAVAATAIPIIHNHAWFICTYYSRLIEELEIKYTIPYNREKFYIFTINAYSFVIARLDRAIQKKDWIPHQVRNDNY